MISSRVSITQSAPEAVSSGRPVVLVDQATENVGALDGLTVIGVAVPAAVRWWCRDVQARASVRPFPIVMAEVRVQNLRVWFWFQIRIQSKHSDRTVRTHRSAYTRSRGARARRRTWRVHQVRVSR